MIVTRKNFQSVISTFSCPGAYGLDTETTGLEAKDRLFSVILADEHQGYYFNFLEYENLEKEAILPREWIIHFQNCTQNPESLFFIHNAKFDMGMLDKEGVYFNAKVHCTESMERVYHNNYLGHKPYSLASCAARRGWKKDGAVEEYIKQHGLITKIKIPGKSKVFERWHFDKVPWEIITTYGENDAVLHRKIGLDQMDGLQGLDNDSPSTAPKLIGVVDNERKLTKVCHRVETSGIHINRSYTKEALAFTEEEAKKHKAEFQALTQVEYEDSAKIFKEVFGKAGIELPLTPTGKPCTSKEVLDNLENPIADKIREIRTKEKLCSTYFSSFLHFADRDDCIHANIRQGGTETSRFSYSDPNLQNLPKEDEPEDREKKFIVRRCFTPINADYCFVPIDYKQQEFRMMLDYAGEKDIIAEIMGGMDVHEATGKSFGVTRKVAKTLNFGVLYGMGPAKLAKALKISLNEAKELRNEYFSKLPGVQSLIWNVMSTGKARGFIWNWFGFRNHISSPEYAYILPNHLIQGGCAQVIRIAMVRLDEYIIKHRLRSSILAQVHDELLFQVHKDEVEHVAAFKKIMEDVYKPKNGLYLECSLEHSWHSWAKFDMKNDAPSANDCSHSPNTMQTNDSHQNLKPAASNALIDNAAKISPTKIDAAAMG